jgi:hypothetical protein
MYAMSAVMFIAFSVRHMYFKRSDECASPCIPYLVCIGSTKDTAWSDIELITGKEPDFNQSIIPFPPHRHRENKMVKLPPFEPLEQSNPLPPLADDDKCGCRPDNPPCARLRRYLKWPSALPMWEFAEKNMKPGAERASRILKWALGHLPLVST